MIQKKLTQLIIQKLNVEPTDSQFGAIEKISSFLYNPNPDTIFLLKGFAGTGKTSLVGALVAALNVFKIQTVLLAPTGRAAKVLSLYTKQPAFTIHKNIYRQQSTADGLGKFSLNYNKYANTIFIVDEASMISNESLDGSVFGSGRLLDDLVEFVYSGRNCRLMLVGDTAQLPPVGLSISPALEENMLLVYDKTIFSSMLTDVVRQVSASGILNNATQLREYIDEFNHNGFFQIDTGFDDIKRVSGEDLIETIGSAYDRYGEEETIVITRSNKRANRFNDGIRRTIQWRESELSKGDLLMIVKNNYYWKDPDQKLEFIANGDIVKVMHVGKYEDLYGFKFCNVALEFLDYEGLEIDCKIFIDTLTLESASFNYEDHQRLFKGVQEDYLEITNKRKRWEKIRENPYFNALQVKHSYAITCHKAQGGQWDAVFIDHGYLLEEMIDIEYLRWFYTAFTRPKKELYLINFDDQFFESDK